MDDQLVSAPAHSLGAVLRLRGFRRLWIGLGLSSLGDWLGLLALTAYAGTAVEGYAAQNFAIAGVLLLRVVPAILLGPIAGYIADRVDRRWTLIAGDVARFALFASIPFVDTLWWVFVVTVLTEGVSLIWMPAKDATIPNLVPARRLEAANQLSLSTTYGSALPAAGLFVLLTLSVKGITTLTGGSSITHIDIALWVNALTYLVSGLVVATLTEIPRGPATGEGDRTGMWRTIVDGWAFVSRTPVVRGLVVGTVGAFAAGGAVIGLARVHVHDLGGGDAGYGVLFGAVFLGLALGMWLGPRLLGGMSRRRIFGMALTAAGLLLFPVALTPELSLVALLVVVLGFCAGLAWVTGQTLLGLEVADSLRGRTFAFVQALIRIALALVLALAPAVSGVIGSHTLVLSDSVQVTYHGAAVTFLIAAAATTVLGVLSYRQMDDRPGVSLWKDVRQAVTGEYGRFADTGLFIVFEGGEGAGKSTQAVRLGERLAEQGYDVVLTHEPGDTRVGAQLRRILLDPETGRISGRTEFLIYAADKAEHVDTLIMPALDRGAVVISDRYVDSTLAYQGAGRELLPDQVEDIARWATDHLRPHLTVVLDVPPDQGMGRFRDRDRIESEPLEFHRRVREAFLQLASRQPDSYAIVDGARDVDQVAAQVYELVQPLLNRVRRVVSVQPPTMAAARTDPTTVQGPTGDR